MGSARIIHISMKETMTRNFGLGTRDLAKAGKIALTLLQQRKGCSFSSAATNSQRWDLFAKFAKSNGVGRMERINYELVQKYAAKLRDQVENLELSPATAQNYLSAVNTVMHAASDSWESVRPVADCSMQKRNNVRADPPPKPDKVNEAIKSLIHHGHSRTAAIAELALQFGLRSKEASLLNCKKALNEAQDKGYITVSDGTKGGRDRIVPVINESQLDALSSANVIQGTERNLIPKSETWKSWREGELRSGREALKEFGITGYHELRATYACARYTELTGHLAPCQLGFREASKQADDEARKQISSELGHGRIDIMVNYIGGMK